MSYLVVANFKSHKTSEEVKSWLADVDQVATLQKDHLSVIVAPSFIHLPLAVSTSSLFVSAQDCSPYPLGSYTGAVSAAQLKDLGVTYTILGHSERRRYFHETPAEIALKVTESLNAGLHPILCLREEDIVPQFSALSNSVIDQCVYCFEPESNIGGAEAASPDIINSVVARIKTFAPHSLIMYGGSVNQDNLGPLLSLHLGGFLVAGASLNSADFIALLEKLTHAL